MRHIKTDELVAANLTLREAQLASVIAEIHTLIEKAQGRPLSDPNGPIEDDTAASILMMTAPVLDLVLGRKQFHPGDVSRIKLIGELAKMQVPVMPTYPNSQDIDNTEAYCDEVEAATERHLIDVRKGLPISGEFVASRRWAEDVAENGYDQAGR